MKSAIVLLLASISASAQFVADFSPSGIHLLNESPEVNGTWFNHIQQNPTSQTIGIGGFAKDDGMAFTQTFPEFDASSDEDWIIYLDYSAPFSSLVEITFYDSEGGSSSWTALGSDQARNFTGKDRFVGNLDWSKIHQLSLGGGGDGSSTVNSTFRELTLSVVPEPGVTAVVTGLALAGFALRRRRNLAKLALSSHRV